MSDHAAGDTVPEVDESRRKFLIAATVATGAVGAVLTAVPFVASWKPSESARAAGLPTEVDLSRLEPGQMTTVFWRKKQVYVVRRTPEMLASLTSHDGQLKDPPSEESKQPAYAKNAARALRPDVFVTIGTCTHLGCLPKSRFTPGDTTISADWPGGFFCPCHGSKFDLAGRVFAGSPASLNLEIPPYSFDGDNRLIVGVDTVAPGSCLMSAVIEGKGGFRTWLNKRLPVDQFMADQLTGYYAPKNFNIWYFFGSLALLVFVMQIVTGIFITMHFKPGWDTAFSSLQTCVREVEYCWLIQSMHADGASFFFIVVYLHMARALMYGSYKAPRELLWVIGMLIYLALMAEAFMGYVLPNGNMSYWGAQVIINLFGVIPGIGEGLTEWIRGDYGIGDATLTRFFSLHVIALPFLIALLIALHLVALRQVGSNNPDGIEIKEKLGADGKPVDGIPFHPYYTLKDIVGVGLFLTLFAIVVFFVPTFGGLFMEAPNFEPANPSSTPEHIAPVWYFTPYYAILRAVPDQKLGALLMGLSVAAFLFLPWLDRAKNKSIRYRGLASKLLLGLFFVTFCVLLWLGLKPADGVYVLLARIFTALYFAFFILLPFVSKADGDHPVPDRVTYHAH